MELRRVDFLLRAVTLSPLLSNLGRLDLIQRTELAHTRPIGIYAKETLWFSQIEPAVLALLLKRPPVSRIFHPQSLARIQNLILFILNQN